MKLARTFALLAVLAMTATVGFAVGVHGQSNAQPADKMAVAGSGIDIGAPGETLTILSGTMKTSAPEDAIVTVSLECDILTHVTTVGNDDSQAFGRIEVWVELDGHAIPVAADDTGDSAGHVVFCDRAHHQTTSIFDDQDATISSFIQTRSANSFQWITLDLGSGDHTFEVKSTLTTTATNNADANAVIGKRVLTVDPTKLANNAVI